MDSDPSLDYLDTPPEPPSPPLPGQAEPLTYKMNQLCPSLFKSLSAAEKETINSYHWLSSSFCTKPPLPEAEMPQLPAFSTPSNHSLHLTSVDPTDFPASSPISPPLPPSLPAKQPSLPIFSIESEVPPYVLPGYRQPEDDDENLLAVLISSTSTTFLPDNTSQLPIYRGKELFVPAAEAGTSSSHHTGNDVKAFAWS
jgi:hypothetical protein